MTSVTDPTFPQQLTVGEDGLRFLTPINCLFNPLYLGNIVRFSKEVTVPEHFRPDLACKDLDYSSKYIKVVNIINGKEKGIFSYTKDEKILAPIPGNISTSVSTYNEVANPVAIRPLPYNIKDTFKQTEEKFNEIISTSSQNVLFNYILKTSEETVMIQYENTIENLYEGILNEK